MTAQISPMHLSGSAKTDPKHTLVASAVVAALFGWGGAAFAQDDSRALATRSPLLSAYRSSETTTEKSERREKVHNGS